MKRKKNRVKFDKLPELLKGAILDAKKMTGKHRPPARAVRKCYKLRKVKMQNKKKKKAEFIGQCMAEVKKRLAAKAEKAAAGESAA